MPTRSASLVRPSTASDDRQAGERGSFPLGRLLVLTAAVFAAVTTEMLPVGLLPQLAESFAVTEERIGWWMSVYAIVVAVGAIPVTALLARWPRRNTLVAILGLYAASNTTIVVAGAVGSYGLALAARVLGGLAHAGMFSVAIATAVALAPRGMAGRAVAVVNLGVTAALTLGVPLGTAAGSAWGWEGVLIAVAVGLLGVGLAARAVLPASPTPAAALGSAAHVSSAPPCPQGDEPSSATPGSPAPGPAGPRPGVLQALTHRPLLHVALVTSVLSLGHYTAYTYVTPLLLHAGIGPGDVGPVLLVHGLASLPGLLLAGALADRHPDAALRSAITLAGLCLVVMSVLPGRGVAVVASIAVWGLAFGALPSLIQTAALRVSPSRDAAPAIVNAMFNVGIAAGAWTGGQLLLRDVTSIAPAGAVLVLLALVLTVVNRRGAARGGR